MKINFSYVDIDKRVILTSKAKKLIEYIVSIEGKKLGEINIIFTSNKILLKINQDYLKHNYLTDVITFDNCVKKRINGDIFISIEQVIANANTFMVKNEVELARVIIHGILHLVGYKDDNKNLKAEMRQKENFFLKIGMELSVFDGNEFAL